MVSALILGAQLGAPAAAEEPSLEQLSRIEAFLSENDIEGLRAYLERHPELLEGDTRLANLLQVFMQESAELPGYLGVPPDEAADEAAERLGQIAPGSGDADDSAY